MVLMFQSSRSGGGPSGEAMGWRALSEAREGAAPMWGAGFWVLFLYRELSAEQKARYGQEKYSFSSRARAQLRVSDSVLMVL